MSQLRWLSVLISCRSLVCGGQTPFSNGSHPSPPIWHQRDAVRRRTRSLQFMDPMSEVEYRRNWKPCAKCLIKTPEEMPGMEKLYWNLKELFVTHSALISPVYYAFPKDTDEVAEVVKKVHQARGVVRVRSGGLSYGPYSACRRGDIHYLFPFTPCVVMDLTRINHTQFRPPDRGLHEITIGGGALMEQLLQPFISRKIAIPFGGSGKVGVAAYIMGGGLGFMSRELGLLSDLVFRMTVVLADGSVMEGVSKEEESDLFWALRGGGGGNLAVVTEITLHLPANFAVSACEAGSRVYEMKYAEQAYQFWFDKAIDTADTEKWNLQFVLTPEEARINYVLDRDADIAFNDTEIPLKSQKHTRNLSEFYTNVLWPEEQSPRNESVFSYFLKYPLQWSALQGLRMGFAFARERGAQVMNLKQTKLICEPLGGKIDRYSQGESAFAWRQAQAFCYLRVSWVDVSRRRDFENHFIAYFQHPPFSQYVLGGYINFLHPSLGKYEDRYYGHNKEKLREVKETYDPDSFFNFPLAIRKADVPHSRHHRHVHRHPNIMDNGATYRHMTTAGAVFTLVSVMILFGSLALCLYCVKKEADPSFSVAQSTQQAGQRFMQMVATQNRVSPTRWGRPAEGGRKAGKSSTDGLVSYQPLVGEGEVRREGEGGVELGKVRKGGMGER